MRRIAFLTSMAMIISVMMLAATVRAQTAEPPEPPAHPSPPYAGVISEDLVNVRCGPGLYYYPLLTVSRGTPVTVEGEDRDWLALRPLGGVWGLIRKSDVTTAADGQAATVSSPSARVYASSASAKRRWCVLAMVTEGQTLQVLGPAEGDMLRVAPPEGSRVFIARAYVTPSVGAVLPPEGTEATVPTDFEPPTLDPLTEPFREACQAMSEELQKPLAERDYEPLIAQFTDIREKTEKDWLKKAADQRIAQLETLRQYQSDDVKVLAVGDELDRRLSELQAARAAAQANAERNRAMERPAFQATGVVTPLENLEDVEYPIKYKLVDENGRPVVVLESSTYNLADYVGKAVGVRGTKTYLAAWRIYLVTVDDLEVLE